MTRDDFPAKPESTSVPDSLGHALDEIGFRPIGLRIKLKPGIDHRRSSMRVIGAETPE